jgi:myo-inositol catabolism protein IolC
MGMALGYDKQLFILAFDHRGSFQKKMFGIPGEPNAEETAKIIDAKSVIFDGFARALSEGAPAGEAGILVDEQFGAEVARKGLANGWIVAMPVEKSGLDYFDFEYGDDFGAHIEAFDPTFSKILVRFNPEGNKSDNDKSLAGLKKLSDWLHQRDRKFLLELLVPAEPAQLESVGGDEAKYDSDVRPGLMKGAIAAMQDAGIEADIWKIEGIDRREDCEMIAQQTRAGGRDGVGCVVLGRGANTEKVEHWLRQGAGVPGYLGFAIGRTIWWDQLKGYLDGSLSRDAAAEQISANYRRAIDVYTGKA